MDLKIQEIKRALDRKADAEGTKKGFAFLENKITQVHFIIFSSISSLPNLKLRMQ